MTAPYGLRIVWEFLKPTSLEHELFFFIRSRSFTDGAGEEIERMCGRGLEGYWSSKIPEYVACTLANRIEVRYGDMQVIFDHFDVLARTCRTYFARQNPCCRTFICTPSHLAIIWHGQDSSNHWRHRLSWPTGLESVQVSWMADGGFGLHESDSSINLEGGPVRRDGRGLNAQSSQVGCTAMLQPCVCQ